MPQEKHPQPQFFTQIDVTATGSQATAPPEKQGASAEISALAGLMREMVAAQDRQNELLEELVGHMSAAQRHKSMELNAWKQANPHLARNCRDAAEALSRVQAAYLESLTDEITENEEVLVDGEFMLCEFLDRFGPRMAHLNGVMQVLAQLSAVPEPHSPRAR